MMFSCQCDKAFRQADESDAERSLVDYRLDGIIRVQVFASEPEFAHQQRELLLERSLLEIKAFTELLRRNVQDVVEFVEELRDSRFLVFNAHAFDCQTDNIHGRETDIAPSYRSLRSEPVLENTCAAAHCRHFMHISLRVISPPFRALVECRVEVQEIREETSCGNLAGELVKVIVRVFRQIADAALLLPDLDREDGSGTIADTFVCRVEDFPDDAASLGRSVRSVVYRAEYHLVAASGVNRVHVVNECLHRLMHPAHGHVDGMLFHPFLALDADQVALDVIVDRRILQRAEVNAFQCGKLVDFLLVCLSYEWCQIEVKCRNCLTSMHFVLYGLHGNTSQDSCRLNSFGRSRFAVPCVESLIQNLVQRVLETGETLGRIIIFVMDMDIAVVDSLADILGKQAFVHVSLRCLGRELHHHAGRRVGIHVRILTCNIIGLSVNDFLENFASLGLAREISLVSVRNIFLGDFLAWTFHKFELDAVLDFLDTHSLCFFL